MVFLEPLEEKIKMKNSSRSQSIFDAFNAKQMSDYEIASSFVPSEKFEQLAKTSHTLLVGPRGSGKTTLLKMLQQHVLETWEHAEAEKFRSEIKYLGIFVPSDMAWGGMVQELGRGKLDEDAHQLFAEAVFAVNVFQATINAMLYKAKQLESNGFLLNNSIEGKKFSAVIQSISEALKIQPKFLTLDSLRLSLNQRLLDIKFKADYLSKTGKTTLQDAIHEIPFASINLIDAIEFALIEFDLFFNQGDVKWALLLDEFEIAPYHIQSIISNQLRSANKKLIFKIALAPCTPHTTLNFGVADSRNDYTRVELWYSDRNSAIKFCNALFKARICNDNSPVESPDEAFGNSTYQIIESELDSENESTTSWGNWKVVFKSLSSKDDSFAEYLQRRKIKISELDNYRGQSLGNTIRKIAPLVAMRDAFKKDNSENIRGRKKLLFAYSGWQAISAISEGNPRWLIAILNLITASAGNKFPVDASTQHDQILQSTKAFTAMLRTVATKQYKMLETDTPVFELLNQIGSYFYDRVIRDSFTEEPPLAFTVDDDVNADTENCLKIALNHGAIVYIPKNLQHTDDFQSLKGKRFRIAYLLAPHFKLPLRSTKEINLSTILQNKNFTKATQTHLSLFD